MSGWAKAAGAAARRERDYFIEAIREVTNMSGWVRAQDIPPSWEGEEVWQWNEWNGARPFWNVVPRGFSREPHHCRGIWYMKFVYPAWPTVEAQAAAAKKDECPHGMSNHSRCSACNGY